MAQEHNWINIFFMILVIFLIISGICWFFGFSIPNFSQIATKSENTFNPMEIKTVTTQAELNKGMEIYSGELLSLTIEAKINSICVPLCSNKNTGGLNGAHYTYDYKYYFDKNDILVCKCDRY